MWWLSLLGVVSTWLAPIRGRSKSQSRRLKTTQGKSRPAATLSRSTNTLEPRILLSSIVDHIGDLALSSSSVFQIGGTLPGGDGGYDQINVSGNLSGNGSLKVELANGFQPQADQRFTLLTYSTQTDISNHFFTNATGLYGFGDGSLYFDVEQTSDKLELVVHELGTPSLLKTDTPALNDFLGEYYGDYFAPISVTIAGSFNISDFVHVTGSISLSWGAVVEVDLNETVANGDDVKMKALTIGVENASAFIGVGGPYQTDSNSDGVINNSDLVNENAKGFVIQDLDLGLALMKPVRSELLSRPELALQIKKKKYLGLQATANQIGFVGFGDDFKLELHNLAVGLNISSGGLLPGSTTIDWASSFPDPAGPTPAGYAVNTGGAPVYLDFEERQISASTDAAILQISEFVYVSGSFAFEKGADVLATVSSPLGDLPVPVPMEVMTIGASNVSAFIGAGGPYRTDGNGDLLLSSLQVGGVDVDPINPNAIGFVVDDLDLAVAILKPSLGGQSFGPNFYAVKATANSVGFVGIDDFKLDAKDLEVNINHMDEIVRTAVDFAETYPATGEHPRVWP